MFTKNEISDAVMNADMMITLRGGRDLAPTLFNMLYEAGGGMVRFMVDQKDYGQFDSVIAVFYNACDEEQKRRVKNVLTRLADQNRANQKSGNFVHLSCHSDGQDPLWAVLIKTLAGYFGVELSRINNT